jgi:hypothetical protein
MKFISTRAAFVLARVLQIIVGVVFLLAASLKALDPVSFVEQIQMYGIFPNLAGLAAWVLVTLEIVLATGLILNWLPRIVPALTVGLLLFFIVITVYGNAIGLGESCGCFGNLVHRGPGQVILEDTLMLLALIFAAAVHWRRSQSGQVWKGAVSALAGALALLTISVSPALPVDDLVTTLGPGTSFEHWPVDGLSGLKLNEGRRIVFLFTLEDDSVASHAAAMSAVAQAGTGATPVGLIIDDPSLLTTLMFQYGITFPVGALEPRFARPLYRALPRSFLLVDGTVVQTWAGIPPAVEVRAALEKSTEKSTQ